MKDKTDHLYVVITRILTYVKQLPVAIWLIKTKEDLM